MVLYKWNRLYVAILVLPVLLVVPVAVFAENSADQRPCVDEIEKFCRDAKPGEGRIVPCLRDHDVELSTVCRYKVTTALRRVDEAKQACEKDVRQFCPEVTPGGGRLVKCLKLHIKELSPDCREVFGGDKVPHNEFEKPVK